MDFDDLYNRYHDEYVFLVKWHPMYYNNIVLRKQNSPDFSKYKDFIFDFSNYRDINDLLIVCDLLITDYSSMIFDYALLNKPIIYFTYDLDDYTKYGGRGLYFDFNEYVYGTVAKNYDELIKAIDNQDILLDERNAFIQKFMDACDGHSTEKTWNYIIEKSN